LRSISEHPGDFLVKNNILLLISISNNNVIIISSSGEKLVELGFVHMASFDYFYMW